MTQPSSLNRFTSSCRLLLYALPYWRYWSTLLMTMGLSVVLELLLPWPTTFLVDNVLTQRPIPHWLSSVSSLVGAGGFGRDGLILLVCLATVATILASTLVNTASDFLRVALGHRLAYRLGGDVLLHLQKLSPLFHKGKHLGDLAARVTEDAYCVQMIVVGVAVPFLQSCALILGTFLVLWQMQPSMALLSLGVVPLLAILAVSFDARMSGPCRARRENEARMAAIVQQTLRALPMVQAFNREEFQHDLYRRCAGEAVASHQRAVVVDACFKTLTCVVTSGGLATSIWFGAQYVVDGRMSVGGIVVVLVYVQALLGPIRSIVESASTWQLMSACADRVSEVMNADAAIKDGPDARSIPLVGHVRFEDVGFSYGAGQDALSGINLEVEAGQTLAIVGPTGAGKTTLLNLLVRLYDPTQGRITIDGHELRNLRIKAVREQVSIVMQEPFILPVTVAENIAYGRSGASREAVIRAAVAANAHEFIQRLPSGYDTVISEQGACLSGGERQRLAIARAFVKDAPILILDEPTSSLDAHTEALLVDALERLRKGRTTFIIAHRLSTIRGADQICVLDRGRVVQLGTHEDLKVSEGLYSSLHAAQVERARGARASRR